MQPYFVLGVSLNAGDETIRQAYLSAVKEFPPDVNPERFQVISAAYAQIKDEQARLRHHFLRRDQPGGSPLGALVYYTRFKKDPAPLPFLRLLQLLRDCAKHVKH